MTHFTLTFFGHFHVVIDGTPITNFHSDKARALLVYLALEPREHARTELAALLWPEIGDQYARTNLRNTLYRLRQTLDEVIAGSGNELLTVTRQSVHFNAAHATVDVLQFQTLLDSARDESEADLDQLEGATDLYQNELLLGFGVDDAPPFEEWLLLRRELLHQQAILAFHMLTTAYERAGYYERAHRVASRQIALDPYREESYRQCMRLLARLGVPEQALQQLEQMRQLLRAELGVDPSAETVALAQAIAAGEFDERKESREEIGVPSSTHLVTTVPPSPIRQSPSLDLADVPDPGPFFGRAQEQQAIVRWLCAEQQRVVALLGLGGIGKTSLAAQCIRALALSEDGRCFEAIYWRSLVNAPPLPDLLSPLLQLLSDQQLTTLPESIDEQLRLLLDFLCEQRVLLVLDNLESILMPEQAGAYRPGYEGYEQLIHQLAVLPHQSHLLLTSREHPHGYTRLERDGYPIRALPLGGLDDAAGQQLLKQRGLSGEGSQEALLIQRYSGNPLALKLVADTVDEIFGGDIGEFLSEEPLVFDDIRTVLDQQFARLSALEQQILFWLAIEREATPMATLRGDLLHSPPQRLLIETLRSLQHRSLLERVAEGFTLQNVVREYLTDRLVEAVSQEIISGDLQLLHCHALVKAQATEYVRESQVRVLLAPIGQRLLHIRTPILMPVPSGEHDSNRLHEIAQRLRQILQSLQQQTARQPSYAAGNVLNLLLHLGIDVTGHDFSQLCVWQAQLRGANLTAVNFHATDLTGTQFTNVLSQIYGVAMNRDDHWLASAGGNGDIQLWKLPTGEAAWRLRGHQGRCTCVAFSPDGSLLASTGFDRTVRLWDVQSGECRQLLRGHQNGAWRLAFNHDGTLLVSGGEDAQIMVWHVPTGAWLATIAHHQDWVNDVAFHPTTNLLASCSSDCAICLWDLDELWQQAQTSDTPVAPDAVQLRTTLHGHALKITALAFSPDGACLASGGADQTICLWDVTSGRRNHTLRGHAHWVRALAFSPDGALLASGSADQTIRLWERESGRCLNTLRGHSHTVWSLCFNRDGRLLASGGQDHALRLWDLHDPTQSRMLVMLQGDISTVSTVALQPGGTLLATADSKGWVRLWQMKGTNTIGRCIRHFIGDSQLWDVAFSADGNYLASAGEDRIVRLWEVATGECIAQLRGHTRAIHCVKFDPSGQWLASAGDDRVIHLWQVDNPRQSQLIATLTGHTHVVEALAFSHDGSWLASCGGGQAIRLWDLRAHHPVSQQARATSAVGDPRQATHVFKSDASDSWAVSFHPNDQRLATVGTDGAVRLWALAPEAPVQLVHQLNGHLVSVRALAINPKGTLLASGGEDNNICLWEWATGRQVHILAGHTQSVLSLVFSWDGRVLISGSNDGTVRLWDVQHGECRQILSIPGPYAEMNIADVTGISEAQRTALKTLGAVER